MIPKDTHPKLIELLQKCWHRDPTERPDFSEILEILQKLSKEVSPAFPVLTSSLSITRLNKIIMILFYNAKTKSSMFLLLNITLQNWALWCLTLKQVKTDPEGRHKTKSGFLAVLKRSHWRALGTHDSYSNAMLVLDARCNHSMLVKFWCKWNSVL